MTPDPGLLQYGPLGILVFLTIAFLGVLVKVLQMTRDERKDAHDINSREREATLNENRTERAAAMRVFTDYATEQRQTFLEHNKELTAQCEQHMQNTITSASTAQREWFTTVYRDLLKKDTPRERDGA